MAVSADIGIFTTDSGLVVQSWDDWLAGATGISSDRARGQRLPDLVPDLAARGLLARFEEALASGAVQILAPAFHRFLIPCRPRVPSSHYDRMQQRVTIGPLQDDSAIVGLIVTVEDVTAQLDSERALAEALASDDPARRKAASDAIAEASRVESFEHFESAIGDTNWQVRRTAVRRLARVADRAVIRSLLSTLRARHRNFSVLSSALRLLTLTDVDATGPLAALLTDEDPDLRIQAALALGEQHDPAAAEPLMRALDDPDPNVRFHAIEALGRLRAAGAVEALSAIVEAGDFFLAFAALDALTLIGDPRVAPRLVPHLQNPHLRSAVAATLGSLGDEDTIPPLAATLDDAPEATGAIVQALVSIHDRVEHQLHEGTHVSDIVGRSVTDTGRRRILDAIPSADQEQLPSLIRALGWLRGPDVQQVLARLLGQATVRTAVIEALVRHGEGVVDLLVEEATSGEREARRAAIVALGRLGSRRATSALIQLLDHDPEIMLAAAGALARIGDELAFEPLLRLIGHPNGAVRQSVIGALNSIGHQGMASRVAALLDDDDPLVRESAVRIAGYFGYRDTTDKLLERTKDPVETVRAAALEHLAYVEDARTGDVLREALERDSPRARAGVAKALAHMDGPAALQGLTKALRDSDLWVRYFAARGMAQRRDAESAASLLCNLACTDPAPHVRIAAIDALAGINSGAAFEALEACGANGDSDIAAAALRAMGSHDGPRAMPFLQQALRTGDERRRLASAQALTSLGTADAVSALEWSASADADPRVSRASIESMGMIAAKQKPGAAAAVEALIGLLGDLERRDAALGVISALPPACVDDVARGLQRRDAEIRRQVVDALGRFKVPEATRWLVEALGDDSAVVRETAVAGLMRLGTRGVDDRLQDLARSDSSKAVRRAAASALAHRRSHA